jgi:hypothetical protein
MILDFFELNLLVRNRQVAEVDETIALLRWEF